MTPENNAVACSGKRSGQAVSRRKIASSISNCSAVAPPAASGSYSSRYLRSELKPPPATLPASGHRSERSRGTIRSGDRAARGRNRSFRQWPLGCRRIATHSEIWCVTRAAGRDISARFLGPGSSGLVTSWFPLLSDERNLAYLTRGRCDLKTRRRQDGRCMARLRLPAIVWRRLIAQGPMLVDYLVAMCHRRNSGKYRLLDRRQRQTYCGPGSAIWPPVCRIADRGRRDRKDSSWASDFGRSTRSSSVATSKNTFSAAAGSGIGVEGILPRWTPNQQVDWDAVASLGEVVV